MIFTLRVFFKFFFYYIRWDDDVVFKNCAKGDDGKKKVRHFASIFKINMLYFYMMTIVIVNLIFILFSGARIH